MHGKKVLVTGASDGIGRQTALELAKRGATVIVHGRSVERAEAAVKEIKKSHPAADLAIAVADLASLRQTRAMADQIAADHPALDVLLNNAGVFMRSRKVTEDGLETTFQVNHLAYFALGLWLRPQLEAAQPSRLINVSSMAHQRGAIDFDDLQLEHDYDGYDAYSLSKVCNILFSYAYARRVPTSTFVVHALHPGVISTKLLRAGFSMSGGDLPVGARTSVHLACSPEIAGKTGGYWSDQKPAVSSPLSRQQPIQEKLWEISERLLTERGFSL